MDAALVALMSLALAGIGASTWRLLARIDNMATQLGDRIDSTNTRIDSTNTRIDSTNTRIDNMATELGDRIDSTNTRIDNMATEINALGQRVARIEGHLLGLEAPAPAGPG